MRLSRTTYPIALALRRMTGKFRVPGWGRVLRAAFPPDKQRDFRFQVRFEDYIYAGRADNFIDWNVLFYGLYEADELRLLAAVARSHDRPVLLDIGANTGHHSLFMAAHVATVHAFEPNPGARRVLNDRMELNRVGNVVVHDCALGLGDEQRPLYVSDAPEYPGASLIVGANDTSEDNFIDVRVRNGDRYLADNGIAEFDLIKIDVEGFESSVVLGLTEAIKKSRPIVQVEISHESRQRLGDLAEFRAIFPDEYRFYAAPRGSARWFAPGVAILDDDGYRADGNVFCVPEEKAGLFEAGAKAAS